MRATAEGEGRAGAGRPRIWFGLEASERGGYRAVQHMHVGRASDCGGISITVFNASLTR